MIDVIIPFVFGLVIGSAGGVMIAALLVASRESEKIGAKTETCEGCKHLGKWENEVEYGCLSPCTCCKRKVEDNYER